LEFVGATHLMRLSMFGREGAVIHWPPASLADAFGTTLADRYAGSPQTSFSPLRKSGTLILPAKL
jgi:hypothetical protein